MISISKYVKQEMEHNVSLVLLSSQGLTGEAGLCAHTFPLFVLATF